MDIATSKPSLSKMTILFWAVALLMTLCAAVAGYFYGQHRLVADLRARQAANPYVNPALILAPNRHFIINFMPLKNALMEIQKKYSQKTFLYFDYFNNATWVGLNEKDLFIAASTIKVPLAMSVYKLSENGVTNLSDRYTVAQADLDNNFGDFYKNALGNSYSVQELTRIMLEQSDNTAMRALMSYLKSRGVEDPLQDVYDHMGWSVVPELGTGSSYIQINAKTLGNMFTALYSATYINAQHSQEILRYLDNSPFNNAIVAGIPQSANIPVAHKIGIDNTDLSYSDCGIVYIPDRRYMLCLGSSGATKEEADKFMVEVSRTVYNYVVNN